MLKPAIGQIFGKNFASPSKSTDEKEEQKKKRVAIAKLFTLDANTININKKSYKYDI